MTVFTERGLEITFNNVLDARKFEDHGFTQMKAVDFVVELPDRYLFIEFKDPEEPVRFQAMLIPCRLSSAESSIKI